MSGVQLSAEAIDDLTDAAAWYRDRRPGLELEFLAEIESVLPLIERAPAAFPRLRFLVFKTWLPSFRSVGRFYPGSRTP